MVHKDEKISDLLILWKTSNLYRWYLIILPAIMCTGKEMKKQIDHRKKAHTWTWAIGKL
jgi:hypothetical protein